MHDCSLQNLSTGTARVAHLDVRSLFPDKSVTLELIQLLSMLELVLIICHQLWLAVPVHKARPVERLRTTASCVRQCQKFVMQEAQLLDWPCSNLTIGPGCTLLLRCSAYLQCSLKAEHWHAHVSGRQQARVLLPPGILMLECLQILLALHVCSTGHSQSKDHQYLQNLLA